MTRVMAINKFTQSGLFWIEDFARSKGLLGPGEHVVVTVEIKPPVDPDTVKVSEFFSFSHLYVLGIPRLDASSISRRILGEGWGESATIRDFLERYPDRKDILLVLGLGPERIRDIVEVFKRIGIMAP